MHLSCLLAHISDNSPNMFFPPRSQHTYDRWPVCQSLVRKSMAYSQRVGGSRPKCQSAGGRAKNAIANDATHTIPENVEVARRNTQAPESQTYCDSNSGKPATMQLASSRVFIRSSYRGFLLSTIIRGYPHDHSPYKHTHSSKISLLCML